MIFEGILRSFFSGHERSVRAKKNIIGLFAVKGYNIAINLTLIPLTLHLLDDYKYGVWITLFNVLSWISIFDIGIGNGLRNKFAEAVAKNQAQEAKEYVSTAYILMGLLALGLIVLFIAPWLIINWANVFNVEQELAKDIFYLVGITYAITAVQFGLKLIGTLLTANHKPAIASIITTLSNTLILICFLVLKSNINESLVGIGLVYTSVPMVVLIFASIWFFNTMYKDYKPQISFFKRDKVKDLFSLGIKYFIIQISIIIIAQTDSLIISHVLSPSDVTPYNIVFRYYSILTMLFGIFLTPLWSAYTEAMALSDYSWIQRIIKKQLYVLPFLIFAIISMILMYKPVIKVWIGKEFEAVNLTLLVLFGIQAFFSLWNNIFGMVLNGLSKVRLSTILISVSALINIPISIFFAKNMNLGLQGIILGTLCSGLLVFIVNPIQVYYFVFNKKKRKCLDKLLS